MRFYLSGVRSKLPLGKLHSERWTPVDEQVRSLIARLRFLRTLPPVAPPDFLLPRPKGRGVLCVQLRAALAEVATHAGITVPHQMRHTYATSLLRAGVSLPALMKRLGHRTANMTLRYVEITQKDLQREFHLAQSSPRHLVPLPVPLALADPDSAGASAVVERLRYHSPAGSVSTTESRCRRQASPPPAPPARPCALALPKSRIQPESLKIGADWPHK